MSALADNIIQYIRSAAPQAGAGLNEQTKLIEGGLLDSLGLIGLVAFLEKTENIVIRDEDVLPSNFESVGTITRLVERIKQNS